MEGQLADDRMSVFQPSCCCVCGTCQEVRSVGAVCSVNVLLEQSCHIRAGFQQCKSFVEMGTVRCCVCVFITAGPITKLFAGGEEEVCPL